MVSTKKAEKEHLKQAYQLFELPLETEVDPPTGMKTPPTEVPGEDTPTSKLTPEHLPPVLRSKTSQLATLEAVKTRSLSVSSKLDLSLSRQLPMSVEMPAPYLETKKKEHW